MFKIKEHTRNSRYVTKSKDFVYDLGVISELCINRNLLIPNDDGTFDYDGSLSFSQMGLFYLTQMPIKLRTVHGSFYCNGNNLISLVGCPQYIKGNFWCGDNKLISLKHFPKEVEGKVDCKNNHLLTYKHNSIIKGKTDFDLNSCKITDDVIETVKQMTLEEQIAELKFFDENDPNASKMFQEILDSLNIEYEIGTQRKEMKKIIKENDLSYLTG